jgi:hypothetical protein
MGAAKVSISHCPINIIRRARVLDNWKSYSALGINIALGSDTYPRDMLQIMRAASYHGKTMSHDYKAATAAEVFAAATLNGARSLGRDDLGRLAPGARADIILIDLTGRGTLRMGPVRDPVKTVVECGVGDDVDTVIVAGEIRMQGGRIPGVDLDAPRAAQAAGERVWRTGMSDPLAHARGGGAVVLSCVLPTAIAELQETFMFLDRTLLVAVPPSSRCPLSQQTDYPPSPASRARSGGAADTAAPAGHTSADVASCTRTDRRGWEHRHGEGAALPDGYMLTSAPVGTYQPASLREAFGRPEMTSTITLAPRAERARPTRGAAAT